MKNQGMGCAWVVLAISLVSVGALVVVMLGCGGLMYLGMLEQQRRPRQATVVPIIERPIVESVVASPPAELPEAEPARAAPEEGSIDAPVLVYFRNDPPQAVCRYLEKEGYETGEYRKELGLETYGTCSPYKDISKGINPNHAAYYVEGSQGEAAELRLVLNVHERAESRAAHAELLSTGDVLVRKATGHSLPPDARSGKMR